MLTMRNAGGHEIHIPLMTLASHGIQKDVYVLYKFCDCFLFAVGQELLCSGITVHTEKFYMLLSSFEMYLV